MNELKKIQAILDKYPSEDVERFFLALKDLLKSNDSKIQTTMQTFILQVFKIHPDILELQGNRVFKSILMQKTPADAKFKVNSII